MFDKNDRIAHPLHGGCIIDSIAEERIDGVNRKYYVLKTPKQGVTVKVPVDSSESVGIRPIVSPETAEDVLRFFAEADTVEPSGWNKRYRENMEKVKSGDPYAVAEVIKKLLYRGGIKGLSAVERKMLADAKQILISELVMSKNQTYEEIEKHIELCCMI